MSEGFGFWAQDPRIAERSPLTTLKSGKEMGIAASLFLFLNIQM